MKREPQELIANHVQGILQAVGEDPSREGLLRTPERVAKAYAFLTQGYQQHVDEVFGEGIFQETCEEMVLVKNIDMYSLCEHHLLPFYGKVHVAYLPKGRIVGLSKIPRVVDLFARRLQVQERLTREIAQTLQDTLQPHGVAVVIEAAHLCMMMRGVEKQNTTAVTSSMLGVFRDDARTRSEFLDLVRAGRS